MNTYEIAFNIACDLLNGGILYGYDADRIFEEIMKKQGSVSSLDYRDYILEHLEELGKEYLTEEKTE